MKNGATKTKEDYWRRFGRKPPFFNKSQGNVLYYLLYHRPRPISEWLGVTEGPKGRPLRSTTFRSAAHVLFLTSFSSSNNLVEDGRHKIVRSSWRKKRRFRRRNQEGKWLQIMFNILSQCLRAIQLNIVSFFCRFVIILNVASEDKGDIGSVPPSFIRILTHMTSKICGFSLVDYSFSSSESLVIYH